MNTYSQTISDKILILSLFVITFGVMTSLTLSSISHILFVIVILLNFKNLDFKKLPASGYALIFFSIAIMISIFANWTAYENPFKVLLKVKYFIIPPLFLLSMHQFVQSKEHRNLLGKLFYLFIIVATIASASGLIAYFTGFNPLKMKPACHNERACGMFGMTMTYAYSVSLVCALLTGFKLSKKEFTSFKDNYYLEVCLVINLAGLAFSHARGAILGYILTLPCFFLFKSQTSKQELKRLLPFFVTIFFSLVIAAAYAFMTRGPESNSIRLLLQKMSIIAFLEKPIWGHGLRMFEPMLPHFLIKYQMPVTGISANAHNNILEHLASTGLLGAVTCLGFHFFWLKEALNNKGSFLRSTEITFILSFFISGMVQYTIGDGENLHLVMNTWLGFQLYRFFNTRL